MVEDCLNGLALLKIHQEIVPDTNKVIEKFAIGNTSKIYVREKYFQFYFNPSLAALPYAN